VKQIANRTGRAIATRYSLLAIRLFFPFYKQLTASTQVRLFRNIIAEYDRHALNIAVKK
jgi:hypothetical protein